MKRFGRVFSQASILLISVLAIGGLIAAMPAARASASSSSLTITPEADAYVSASYPDTNYGTGTTLRVDGSPDVRSFIRFSVSGVGSQQVSQAMLQIYPNSSGSAGIAAASVADNTWGETAITYAGMPAMGAALASSGAVVAGTWISLDVTAYVTGDGVYSFGMTTPGSTAISLGSRESGANAPRLVLTISGGAAATATLGPASPTPSPTSVSSTPTAAPATPTMTATSAPPPTGGIQHVFVIVMENKSYSQVWNTSSSRYITSLGNSYVRATNYHATAHPSLPNYLEMYAGSNYGITTDCSPSSTCHSSARSLADNLEAAGLSWKAYEESMPAPCYVTTSGNYAPKHDPFVYFDDIRNDGARCSSHVVPYTALPGDLGSASSTPNFAFITPDLCSDMHNCSIKTGDTWLKQNVPPILNSPACTSDKCLLILTWDEDNGSSGNRVLTIFAGSGAQTGGATSAVPYTHYSLLRTVEYIFGLPTQTGNDAAASPMTDMLR